MAAFRRGPGAVVPRALILRAADRLTDHPGPTTACLQRVAMLALIDTALTLVRVARNLSR
jgi:hypothetical protein